MAFSQTDLDNLNAAIATGELTVEFGGRRVTYRSIDDLIRARSLVAGELAGQSAAQGATRRGAFRVTFTTHRGD